MRGPLKIPMIERFLKSPLYGWKMNYPEIGYP